MLTIPTMDELRSDLIFAGRMLRKNPGFAAAAVLTLALGIGVNTAIFSLCNAVLFKALLYSDPDRIVMLWETLLGKPITVAPANFFSLLGIQLAFGRSFLAEDDHPGYNHVAMLSHRVWQERFGADKDIVGKINRLNDETYNVVGVLPTDFQLATNPAGFQARSQIDVWVPLALDLEKLKRSTGGPSNH